MRPKKKGQIKNPEKLITDIKLNIYLRESSQNQNNFKMEGSEMQGRKG